MIRTPGVIAILIAAAGIAAVALVPAQPFRPAPDSDWTRPAGFRPETPHVVAESRIVSLHLVESDSPILGPDGTLVEALGMVTQGGRVTPLIPRGARAPAGRMIGYAPSPGRPGVIEFQLVRGISESAPANHSLGRFRVSGLGGGAPGAEPALLIVRVAGGRILLGAVDPATRKPLPVERIGGPPGP